jgi:ABC-type phosphonate transport system ATPase subunit
MHARVVSSRPLHRVLALATLLTGGLAAAQEPIKVGLLSTLSGPGAALGVDIRDGFQLAVKQSGGKLGGRPAEVMVAGDNANPDIGRQTADRLVRRDKERGANMGNQLSGGEQQMLAIGRALMTNPRLLILDEATEGLAPLIREDIWACLAKLRARGQSILVIDKHVRRLIALANRHTIVERGRVVWQGDSDALADNPSLWHRYLGV